MYDYLLCLDRNQNIHLKTNYGLGESWTLNWISVLAYIVLKAVTCLWTVCFFVSSNNRLEIPLLSCPTVLVV